MHPLVHFRWDKWVGGAVFIQRDECWFGIGEKEFLTQSMGDGSAGGVLYEKEFLTQSMGDGTVGVIYGRSQCWFCVDETALLGL